ncbi:hypothetical protein LGN09_24035 [Burkholderia cenocepacia]|uniref:hypothetical protein n=1 Tax=Burkholderia cenocepacia TaxID=95486 RepID=UPI001CF58BEB|nr:hypothetical protein [Burkholderia cenocepacia]MCA8407981.1 hypothetical protein [Burkholderia cenocepacia]
MAKRYLSPAYRAGVETFVSKMREWRADPEHDYPHQTAAKMRQAVTSLDDDERTGFEEALALLFHMYAFEGCGPCFESWDPIPELEDPAYRLLYP